MLELSDFTDKDFVLPNSMAPRYLYYYFIAHYIFHTSFKMIPHIINKKPFINYANQGGEPSKTTSNR